MKLSNNNNIILIIKVSWVIKLYHHTISFSEWHCKQTKTQVNNKE